MNIPNNLVEKYEIPSIDYFFDKTNDNNLAEICYCEYFLAKTDHIPNKIIEAQILNKEVEDYTDILNLRQSARDRINELSNV